MLRTEFNTIEGYASFLLMARVEGRWKSKLHFVRDMENGDVFDYTKTQTQMRVIMGVLTSKEMMELLEEGLRECWRSEWNFTANRDYSLGHWICI